MRISDPKRPGQDAEKNFEQLYKWMYQTAEQLNMMMEQLERNNVLDLQAGFGTASEDGLLSGSVAGNTAGIAEIRQELETQGASIKELEEDVSVLEAHLGGYTILTGTATVGFGQYAHSVTVQFGKSFAAAPVVIVSQVFNDKCIGVQNANINTTRFIAETPSGFTGEGTRAFKWIAIGKLKE